MQSLLSLGSETESQLNRDWSWTDLDLTWQLDLKHCKIDERACYPWEKQSPGMIRQSPPHKTFQLCMDMCGFNCLMVRHTDTFDKIPQSLAVRWGHAYEKHFDVCRNLCTNFKCKSALFFWLTSWYGVFLRSWYLHTDWRAAWSKLQRKCHRRSKQWPHNHDNPEHNEGNWISSDALIQTRKHTHNRAKHCDISVQRTWCPGLEVPFRHVKLWSALCFPLAK